MNTMRMLTNKWTLAIGMGILITAAANVSLAAPPGPDGRGDGYRGDRDGGRGNDRPVYNDRDRNFGRDRDNDRGRFDGPDHRGGFEPGRGPGFFQPTFRPSVVCGGDGPVGVRVIGGMPGLSITVIIR